MIESGLLMAGREIRSLAGETFDVLEPATEIAMGRVAQGRAEDIAAAVTFLASDQAGYITGETIHVNGGMYMA